MERVVEEAKRNGHKNPLVLRICELRCNIAAQVEKEKAD